MLSHEEAQELHRLIGSALTDLSCMVPHAPLSAVADEREPALTRALELAAVLVSDTMEGGRDTDPSPVSHAPCITGKVEIGGQVSDFLILLDRADVGFSQWGAGNPVLWERVDLLDELSKTAKEWALDNLRTDNEEDNDD